MSLTPPKVMKRSTAMWWLIPPFVSTVQFLSDSEMNLIIQCFTMKWIRMSASKQLHHRRTENVNICGHWKGKEHKGYSNTNSADTNTVCNWEVISWLIIHCLWLHSNFFVWLAGTKIVLGRDKSSFLAAWRSTQYYLFTLLLMIKSAYIDL